MSKKRSLLCLLHGALQLRNVIINLSSSFEVLILNFVYSSVYYVMSVCVILQSSINVIFLVQKSMFKFINSSTLLSFLWFHTDDFC